MKSLITRPRSLLLAVALAVVAALCTVSAANAASSSGDTPIPAAPSNLTAKGVSPTSVKLAWKNNASNQSGVVISLDGVTSVNVQGAKVSSYTWKGLSKGTWYWFYIASKIYGTPGDPTGPGNTQSAWVGPAYAITTGWAGSSFCGSFPESGALTGAPFDGMAACGGKWDGGTVQYKGLVFESAPTGVNTWQCVELAARWFYIDTALRPVPVDYGKNVASEYHGKYKQFALSKATSKFNPSIHAGDIISMWGGKGSDQYGHVAVVTHVKVKGDKGTISLIEENGAASGRNFITVTKGQMSYGSSGSPYFYTTFQWITLPPA
jgi:hypothetical protein